MYPRSDSPPPRQPSPDLIPIPLSSPPRVVRGRVTSLKPVPRLPQHLTQHLTTSRSYDVLDHQKRPHNTGRHLVNSRSCDNIRMRTDLQLSETSTINEDSPVLPSPPKEHHISFRFPRPSTATLPPVPPLPSYLRMHYDDSDTEKSSQLSCDSSPSLASKESTRRSKSPPPPPRPLKRRLVSFTRIRLFSWGESRSRSQAAGV